MLLEFSFFYFSKISNIFLNKVQKSYCYSQLRSYREEFLFKPVSNQLNIFAGCDLTFIRSLNASYLERDRYFSVY